MNPLLSVKGLGCDLGKPVLRDVSFELEAGEVVGVIGPNGSGKSTLLHCLNGTRAASGTVWLSGRDLAKLGTRAVAQSLALMQQHASVSFAFPSRDVVMMGRHPHRGRLQPETDVDRRVVDQSLAKAGASALAEQPITQISGGERQRVFFAKTLAQQTAVLLLDEPTSHLDLAHQESLFAATRAWAREGGAVLAAVHDLRLAARQCDRLILLSHGRVLAQGTPAEVLTPERLTQAYGVSVHVYRNPVTGLLDYQFRPPEAHQVHVHVLGGGGSARSLLRLLGQAGYRVTLGMVPQGDGDLDVAAAFGMAAVVVPPFAAFPQAACDENAALVRDADVTVLANLPMGELNRCTLESALDAVRLVVIENTPPESRDATRGEALGLYRRLTERATVLVEDELLAWLGSGSGVDPQAPQAAHHARDLGGSGRA